MLQENQGGTTPQTTNPAQSTKDQRIHGTLPNISLEPDKVHVSRQWSSCPAPKNSRVESQPGPFPLKETGLSGPMFASARVTLPCGRPASAARGQDRVEGHSFDFAPPQLMQGAAPKVLLARC